MSSTNRNILTVDCGNSTVKGTLFKGDEIVGAVGSQWWIPSLFDDLLAGCELHGIACCNVGVENDLLNRWMDEQGCPVIRLDSETPLPIKVEYGTPQTLGVDRIAAAVAVADPEKSLLVVDAGTAITSDIVVRGVFLGGNISPGVRMRFTSLHNFTASLPFVDPQGDLPEFGYDTETAIRAGVVGGIVAQLMAEYQAACLKYNDINLILTGGDARLLQPLLASKGVQVNMESALVAKGLLRIFNYNNNND